MKLTKAQREVMLSWISEGLTTDIINERATTFEEPFKVIRQNVDQYRKRYGIRIAEMSAASDFKALHEGLSKKAARVSLLHNLAGKLTADIFDNDLLWVKMVKGIGGDKNYERVQYEEFNRAEVEQLRGVLDDIAIEVGDRKKDQRLEADLHIDTTDFERALDVVYGPKDGNNDKSKVLLLNDVSDPGEGEPPVEEFDKVLDRVYGAKDKKPARKPAKKAKSPGKKSVKAPPAAHVNPALKQPMTAAEWNKLIAETGNAAANRNAANERKRRSELRK